MNLTRLIVLPLAALALLALASCDTVTPLHKKQPVLPSAFPADFAIVIDENYDTYYTRTHIEQIISAKDLLSRTTYTQLRDLNNTVSNQYSQDHPLNAAQVQAMWDQVQAQELMKGAWTWTYFYTDSDFYKWDAKILQIRANGQLKSYKQINHWDGALRELSLLVQSVRLPITGGGGTADTTEPAANPAGKPAAMPTDAIGDPLAPAPSAATQK
jgi:hypothetical protein